jgi:hypothetical protein
LLALGGSVALVTLLVHETEALPAVGHVREADQQVPGRGFGLIEPGAEAASCSSAARPVLGVDQQPPYHLRGCLHVDVIERIDGWRFGIVLLGPHTVVHRLLLLLEQILEDELGPSATASLHQRATLVELSPA